MAQASRRSKRSYRRRVRQMVKVLIKYGFEDVLSQLSIKKWLAKQSRLVPKREGKSVLNFSTYERIRMAIEELGTSYIKFAQIAANRPDLLPKELLQELKTFHDHAPLIPEEKIKEILLREYDRPLEELFEHINFKPLASASIAQVHYARVLGGREVVLKVQRPGIEERVFGDIEIMMKLAQAIEKRLPQYAAYQPVELVKMFERSIEKEIQFRMEAANIKRFQNQFKDNPNIYVPDVWLEFTTDKVLCMEYIRGMKITDVEAFRKLGFSNEEIVHKGITLYFEQVFDHGFFHADPHPGNIFLLGNGKICFIDFGMMGSVTEHDKETLAELLLCLANRDVLGLKKILLQEFTTDREAIDQSELEYYIMDFFDSYSHQDIGDIDIEAAVGGLNTLFFDFKIRVPPNLLLLLKAMVIIEGLGLRLYPSYNIIQNITPFATKLLEVKMSSRKLIQKVSTGLSQTSELIENLPGDVAEIVDKIKQGKLHVEFEHKGLQPIMEKMEIVNNRLSFSLVLAALILGSSIVVIADVPPHIYGISVLGFGGFCLSGLLALKLLVSIIRHGNF
jgi:ubiquinone biosynthesis protein